MALESTRFDTADHLKTREDVVAYLEAVFEDGEPSLITHALGVIARSEGMTDIARAAGVTRASLYKSLSADGHPDFETVLRVVRALGLKLTVAA